MILPKLQRKSPFGVNRIHHTDCSQCLHVPQCTDTLFASHSQTQPPAVGLTVPAEIHLTGGGIRGREAVGNASQAQQHRQHGIEPERTARPGGGACRGCVVHIPSASRHRAPGQHGSSRNHHVNSQLKRVFLAQ